MFPVMVFIKDIKMVDRYKELLIARIWSLAEPSLDWYSRMIQRLLEDLPDEKLQDIIDDMDDPDVDDEDDDEAN